LYQDILLLKEKEMKKFFKFMMNVFEFIIKLSIVVFAFLFLYVFLYSVLYIFNSSKIDCFIDNKLVYSGPSLKVSTESCGNSTKVEINDSFMAYKQTSQYVSDKVVIMPK
jgi:hypothetical protein